jgi:hypothetical protein
MRVVPLITSAIFGVALTLMLSSYGGDWSVAKGNLASIDAGLWSACVETKAPWTTPAGSFGRVKTMPQCFTLSRQSSAALGMSNKLFGLLKATRAMGEERRGRALSASEGAVAAAGWMDGAAGGH